MSAQAKNILVIDDDPDVHEALKLILEAAGYNLTACSTGQEGLDAVKTNPPDAILLDIMLSSPSEGFHLAYELRRDEGMAKIPIIMISSIGETMGMDFAKDLGSEYVPADKFLEKPLKAAVVLDAIKEVLGKTPG